MGIVGVIESEHGRQITVTVGVWTDKMGVWTNSGCVDNTYSGCVDYTYSGCVDYTYSGCVDSYCMSAGRSLVVSS